MKIIISCRGGLSNRINSLITGLAFLDVIGEIEFELHWPKEEFCDIDFNSLFRDVIFDPFQMKMATESLKQHKKIFYFSHDSSVDNNSRFASVFNLGDMKSFFLAALGQEGAVLISSDILPSWVVRRFAMQGPYIEHNLFKRLFLKRLEGHPKTRYQGYLGLHLRQTDFPGAKKIYKRSVSLVKLFLKLGYTHIVAFSDSDAALMKIKTDVPDIVIHESKKPVFVSGFIDRDSESMVSSLDDLLFLAHTHIIPNSKSTFLDLAVRVQSSLQLCQRRKFIFRFFDLLRARYYYRIELKRTRFFYRRD